MEWFSGCESVEEVRARYKALAMKHHPDLGGDTATMQEINAAYGKACDYWTRHKNPERAETYYTWADAVNESLRAKIDELLKVPGVTVELCGWWIWVGGDTRAAKDTLHALGLKYSGNKKLWFFAGCPSRSHKPYTIEDIRNIYGSVKYQQKEDSYGGFIG